MAGPDDELAAGLDWLGLTSWVLAAATLPPWVMLTAALMTLSSGPPEETVVAVDGELRVVMIQPGLGFVPAGLIAAGALGGLVVVGGGLAGAMGLWERRRRPHGEVVALIAPVAVSHVRAVSDGHAGPEDRAEVGEPVVAAAVDGSVAGHEGPPRPAVTLADDAAPPDREAPPSDGQPDLAPRGAVDRFIGGDDGVP